MENHRKMLNTRSDDVLAGMLRGIARYAGHGALFYDSRQDRIQTVGVLPPFCRWCLDDARLAGRCRAIYADAAVNSLSAAEPFYYTCWAGLLFAAMAIAPFARCRGCVAICGFRSVGDVWSGWPVGADNADDLRRLSKRESDRAAGLFAAAPVITASDLRGLGVYLQDASFASGLNSSAYFRRRNAIYLQQRMIAEHARRLIPSNLTPAALLRRADNLVACLTAEDDSRRDMQCARYLAAVLKACAWDLARLKAHLRVPLALLTRDALLRGEDWAIVTRAELRCVARLDQARAVEDVCLMFRDILTDAVARAAPPAGADLPLAERVFRWLEENFAQPVTLAMAARAVGASAPCIIKHVRHDTGKTFHALLQDIRIAESKRLLATTQLDLVAVAQQCGFCDQSHFTRHFRRAINLTPGRFRKLMEVSEAEVLRDE